MVNPALPDLPVYLEPDEDIEVMNELIDEMTEEFTDTIEDAYPDGSVPLAYKLPGRQLLLAYMDVTSIEEWVMLQDKDCLPKIRAEIYMPFQSWYWSGLSALPLDFERDRKEFLGLYKRFVVDGEGPL